MKTIVAVIFLVFVIIAGFTVLEKERALYYYEINQSGSNIEISSSEDIVEVTLTGCIEDPGVYFVSMYSSLNDAILQAGGITEQADETCFNYDLTLQKNIDIYIAPKKDEEKISLNSSDATKFKELDGIGETISKRIIDYRTEIGNFEYLEQIMEVSGIGHTIFDNIKDDICL